MSKFLVLTAAATFGMAAVPTMATPVVVNQSLTVTAAKQISDAASNSFFLDFIDEVLLKGFDL